MKRSLACICLLILLCTALVGCAETGTVVRPNENAKVALSFAVDESWGEFSFAPISLDKGAVGGALPLPTVDAADYCEWAWFYDAEGKNLYDPAATVQADTTLYLGQIGKVYRLSYEHPEDVTFTAPLPQTYRYGVGVSLPQATQTPVGYHKQSTWKCEGQDSYWLGVPASAHGDLTLVWHAVAIEYSIGYASGIEGVAASAVHGNPTVYTVEMGDTLVLEPASYSGRTFAGWVLYPQSSTHPEFVVNGELTVIDEPMYVTSLSFEAITWGQFTLVATWEEAQ